jgi:hypothetical protein
VARPRSEHVEQRHPGVIARRAGEVGLAPAGLEE